MEHLPHLRSAPGGLSTAMKSAPMPIGDVSANAPQLRGGMRTTAPQPGTGAMKQLFYLPEGSAYFNASYGNVPLPVMQAQWALQMECESNPQAWMLGNVALKLQRVRRRLANYVGSNVEDLALVENCTSGANAVLRSLPVAPGSTLIHLSTAYGVIKNSMAYVAKQAGGEVVEIPVEFPGNRTSPTGPHGVGLVDSVIQAIEDAQARGSEVALACLDHIASCPGVLMPVVALANACKERGVPVMLDGAHVLGQMPVNLRELEQAGVTYWIADAHKWLLTPKGSAVLWVCKEKQTDVVPSALGAVVASSASTANFNPAAMAGLSDFEKRFQYTGTRDYTPLAAIDAAMDFREAVGESTIIGYNRGMALWAQSFLAELWGTEVLLPDEQTCAMAHVRLPGISSKPAADAVCAALKKKYNIHVMFFRLPGREGQETYWVRPCIQIYVTREEVEGLGNAILELAHFAPAAAAAAEWRDRALRHRPARKFQPSPAFSIPVSPTGQTSMSPHSPDCVLLSVSSSSSLVDMSPGDRCS